MITSTIGFAVHILMSSYRILAPVAQILEYVLPYRNMATKAVKGKINFDTKHLGKGDPLPPYNGKLRIYNMRYCPFAQRTILVLNAKQIDYEVVNIDLKNKPEWLTTKSPLGKVPAIEIKDGVCIYESLITSEYLDEAYPQRPLLPKDPVAKANEKIIVEFAAPIYNMFMKILYKADSITPEVVSAYNSALAYIQEELRKRGTKFLGGNEPGYADYMIWPWFERLLLCQKIEAKCTIDPKQYKLLVEYINNMSQDPAVSQYLMPSEAFLKLLDAYRQGGPLNYDALLDA